MREMSVTEQKYQAILAVVAEGRTIAEASCHLVLGPSGSSAASSSAFVTVDQEFFGANVPAHNLQDLHVLFKFEGQNFADAEGWQYDRETAYTLEGKSIRGKIRRS
jgi:hypothetical protein